MEQALVEVVLQVGPRSGAVNARTKTLDRRGFDSVRFLILRGGIPRPKGNFPEVFDSEIMSLWTLSMRTGRLAGSACTPI